MWIPAASSFSLFSLQLLRPGAYLPGPTGISRLLLIVCRCREKDNVTEIENVMSQNILNPT